MTTKSSAPPTIIINTPGSIPTNTQSRPQTPIRPRTATTTVTSPIKSRTTPPRIATPPTAHLTSFSTQKSCYLCDEQNPGDFTPTTKYLERCLLCSRDFCPVHKSTQWPGTDTAVCNINHSTYYHQCLEEARGIVISSSSYGNVTLAAEELLLQDGIYPSLGEREKVIFSRIPVSDDQVRQIAEYRSLGAERSGTKGQRRSTLIETKSFIGADIAA